MTTLTSDQPTDRASRRPWEPRLDFDAHAPRIGAAMAALDRASAALADEAGLAPGLRELVRLRASQLNGCAYCVDMHAKDARAGGETQERLDALAVWREVPSFDEDERAALALAEAITLCADAHVPDDVYSAAAKRFDAAQLAALVAVTVTINAWNRIGVATRAWLPGSYQP